MGNSRDFDIIKRVLSYSNEISDTIRRFGDSFDILAHDKDYYKSISMSLMQIGELTTHLSDEFRSENKGIQWGLIKGMRNHVAHDYARMSVEEVWDTATKDIPGLTQYCAEWIKQQTPAEYSPAPRRDETQEGDAGRDDDEIER
jgi:uncharacterized protein with HEPN domain